jgi:hypothetical protein
MALLITSYHYNGTLHVFSIFIIESPEVGIKITVLPMVSEQRYAFLNDEIRGREHFDNKLVTSQGKVKDG